MHYCNLKQIQDIKINIESMKEMYYFNLKIT